MAVTVVVGPSVVNVHAEPVPRPVHEELPIVVHGKRVRHVAREQTESDQPLRQHLGSRLVNDPHSRTRNCRGDAGTLGSKNDFVDNPLRFGKHTVDRKGPRDVGREIPVLSGRVDQKQIAVFHPPIVFRVMQNCGIRPRCDYRGISIPQRPNLSERVLHSRLDLILVCTGNGEPHRLQVTFRADPGGFAQ